MLNRSHFDPFERDALLGGRETGIVDAYHLNTCRSCREALLDLALMAGLARGAPFDDPLEQDGPDDDASPTGARSSVDRSSSLDVESVFAQFAAIHDPARTSREPSMGQTHHLLAPDMESLLAAAFAADAQDPRFIEHLRHLRECGTCLGRFLRVSGQDMPSPRLVRRIARALQPGSTSGPEGE